MLFQTYMTLFHPHNTNEDILNISFCPLSES